MDFHKEKYKKEIMEKERAKTKVIFLPLDSIASDQLQDHKSLVGLGFRV